MSREGAEVLYRRPQVDTGRRLVSEPVGLPRARRAHRHRGLERLLDASRGALSGAADRADAGRLSLHLLAWRPADAHRDAARPRLRRGEEPGGARGERAPEPHRRIALRDAARPLPRALPAGGFPPAAFRGSRERSPGADEERLLLPPDRSVLRIPRSCGVAQPVAGDWLGLLPGLSRWRRSRRPPRGEVERARCRLGPEQRAYALRELRDDLARLEGEWGFDISGWNLEP